MWEVVEVAVGQSTVRGRFRLEGEVMVLEWRGGRHAERCGLIKPEVVATCSLKRLASAQTQLAA